MVVVLWADFKTFNSNSPLSSPRRRRARRARAAPRGGCVGVQVPVEQVEFLSRFSSLFSRACSLLVVAIKASTLRHVLCVVALNDQ